MAKISLREKLAKLSLIEFEFASVTSQVTKDKEKIAVLRLVTPIDEVIGSQRVPDDSGALHTVFAQDVMEVRVHQRDFDESEDFVWDEEANVGYYKGDKLSWDVAKRTQDAWLVSEPFINMGNNMRSENTRKSYAKYIPAGAGVSGPVIKKVAGPIVTD